MTVVRKPQRGPDGKNLRREASNEAKAILRSLRVSPQKLNLVAQSIRGLSAEKAKNELRFSQKRIAKDVLKCLQSAMDNAENNHGLDLDGLVVAQAYVGKNLVMKRFHARARGRGVRVEKPFSQITIVLRDTTKQPEPAEAA
ncbi:MAG TPA: 50S ribosomal protein L22 [Terricaulis sp.]|nr:50S ribosomal protein L22 [Terricaulis sp.]HRP12417.1 50S ribosomal protein L22 [Terricaulis sp.]